jgi:hypothetical protein
MKVNSNKVYSFSNPEYIARTVTKAGFTELLSSKINEKNTNNVYKNMQEQKTNQVSLIENKFNNNENNLEKMIFPGKIIDRRI